MLHNRQALGRVEASRLIIVIRDSCCQLVAAKMKRLRPTQKQ